jgi:hypothetical protein
MKPKILYITFITVLLISCLNNDKISKVDFRSGWDTLRVLRNPGKGWYHHLLDNGVNKYGIKNDSLFLSFPGMDHIYLRLAWSYLEPEEGKFDWHRIDSIISKYVPLGYGISFRITSKETGRYPGSVNQEVDGVQYAAPYWVRKAGAKGVVAVRGNTKSWTPDWDDPVYLSKLDNLHHAFAEKYDGKPYLRYIDIGSIGEWGEGHTSFSTRIPPSPGEVKANIDIFLKNYGKSQLVVTDDLLYYGKKPEEVQELYNYCVAHGITLRDDSPLVNWYLHNYLETWSVSHPHFYDPLYHSKPIVFELEHYRSVKRDTNWIGRNGSDTIKKYGYPAAYIMKKAIETLHATYIGFHGYAEEWYPENPDLTAELANRCGYWYFPVSISFNRRMTLRENNLTFIWLNKGVAPAYDDYSIILRFRKSGSEFFDVMIDKAGNRDWLPGKEADKRYEGKIPSDVAGGNYKLLFRLVRKSPGEMIPVDVGLKKEMFDKDGFIYAGKVRII